MRHLAYAVMLVVVLCGTLPLHRVFGLTLAHQLPRVARAILPVAVVFLVWDVAATRAGHWSFDAAQVLAPRVAGLPLEEIAFFGVIPLAGLLTYEAVGVVLHRGGLREKGIPAQEAPGHDGSSEPADPGERP